MLTAGLAARTSKRKQTALAHFAGACVVISKPRLKSDRTPSSGRREAVVSINKSNGLKTSSVRI